MPMDDLPRNLAALVDEARAAHDPTAEDARRVGAALSAGIAGFAPFAQGGQVAVKGTTATASASTQGALASLAGTGKWIGSLVVMAAVGGTITMQATQHRATVPRADAAAPSAAAQLPAAEHAITSAAPLSPAPAAAEKQSLAPSPPAAPAQPVRAVTRLRPKAAAAPAVTVQPFESPPRTDTAEELALIRQATQALRDQQSAIAIELLEQHAARFPQGVFAQERAGMTAIALCRQGRVAEGRALTQAFLASAPKSPLATRVQSACANEAGHDP
jgi:hypothetical protein